MNAITRIDQSQLWPDEHAVFNRESVDNLYAWAYQLGASGIRLQTDRPIIVQLHGRVRRVTRRSLSGLEVEEAVNRLYGADGQARLKSGEDFDVSYEIQPDRRTRLRFRVNATAVLSRGNDGAAVTARPLPNVVPHLDDLGIEPAIREHYRPRDGLVIISGGTGNGKSTTLAAMERETIEDPESHAAILEYAAPIEFVFDNIHGPTATIEQSEIPRHLPSFAAGIRNAMRREPNVIVVGECRDGETMGAATNAALTAHAVYTTIHAGSVAESMQRIVSLCPAEERASLTVAIAQTMRLIVNQRLVHSTDGKRTALREILPFTREVRDLFLDARPDEWHKIARSALARHGQTFADAASRAWVDGRITEEVARPFLTDAANVA